MQQAVRTIRQIARHEASQRTFVELGLVTSVFGSGAQKEYHCTVKLRESGIVLPRVPIAASVMGFASLPRENDLVVVLFAGGDMHAPVVIGRLYNEEVEPPKHDEGEVVAMLPADETSTDKQFEFRLKTPGDGTRSMLISLAGSVKVEVEVKDDGVRIQTTDAKFELKQSGSSDATAEITVGKAKATLSQNGDIQLEAGGKLVLKGMQVEVSGDQSVKISGTKVDIN